MELVIESPTYGIKRMLIDKEDYHLLKDKNLYLNKAGQFLYAYANKKGVHRIVTQAPKNMVVDHINRNTLDNRRINLKVCTIQQNLRNQKRPNNKTGVTGVSINGKGYQASIKVNYNKIYLGYFKTIKEAASARRKAEDKYWK